MNTDNTVENDFNYFTLYRIIYWNKEIFKKNYEKLSQNHSKYIAKDNNILSSTVGSFDK